MHFIEYPTLRSQQKITNINISQVILVTEGDVYSVLITYPKTGKLHSIGALFECIFNHFLSFINSSFPALIQNNIFFYMFMCVKNLLC